MSKQDRPGLRNPADFERRYNLSERFYEQTQFNESVSYDLNTVKDSLGLHKQNTTEQMNGLSKSINELDQSLNQSGIFKRLSNDGVSQGLQLGGAGNFYFDANYIINVVGSAVLQAVYPVGSFYSSDVPTNPAELFGFGTWERLEGVVILAASDKYPAGSTGGEAEHTLTEGEMPSHTHRVGIGTSGSYLMYYGEKNSGGTSAEWTTYVSNASPSDNTVFGRATGGSQPHNNMMPYYAAYVWRRTA